MRERDRQISFLPRRCLNRGMDRCKRERKKLRNSKMLLGYETKLRQRQRHRLRTRKRGRAEERQ
jgi:hypothetical protein